MSTKDNETRRRPMPRGLPKRHRSEEHADRARGPMGDRPTKASEIFTGRPLKEQTREDRR